MVTKEQTPVSQEDLQGMADLLLLIRRASRQDHKSWEDEAHGLSDHRSEAMVIEGLHRMVVDQFDINNIDGQIISLTDTTFMGLDKSNVPSLRMQGQQIILYLDSDQKVKTAEYKFGMAMYSLHGVRESVPRGAFDTMFEALNDWQNFG